jgi:hypothetical protein
MSEQVKKAAVEDRAGAPHLNVDLPQNRGQLSNPDIEKYLTTKEKVLAKDRADFEVYLNEKRQIETTRNDAAQNHAVQTVELNRPSKLDRRTILKVVTGTAVAGEAAALGYGWVNSSAGNQSAGDQGTGSSVVGEPQREPIVRELASTKSDVGGRSLGRWILLLPTKLGGGTYAIDLNSNRVLGSIWYWNYGDYSPISHHLCAFPSADPYHSFEFVNSTQGGKNSLIYGIPTRIQTPEPGFNIYRVRYDGAQMELLENVSETTGLGLGVHVTINPKDAQSYFVTDGQKDIAACFDRNSSRVIAALKFDWVSNTTSMSECLAEGRHPEDREDLSRRGDRQVRLPRHQGPEDRMGNGADGRAVRRGRHHSRRRSPWPHRRRRHHLAPERSLGRDRGPPVRRRHHPRCREELRAGRLRPIQQGLAGPVSREEDR